MSDNKKRRGQRRTFSPEFKADVVNLCLTGTESILAVCKRLDLAETSVRTWVQNAKDAGEVPAESSTTSDRKVILELRRELNQVKMERDILKKATAFFAKENS